MADGRLAAASHLPSAEEAQLWVGMKLDSIDGTPAGKVAGVLVDASSGDPVWLAVRLGRFGHHTAIPFDSSAAAGDRVWAPFDRAVIRSGPEIDPAIGFGAELELALATHFDVSPELRRRSTATARAEGITSIPLAR